MAAGHGTWTVTICALIGQTCFSYTSVTRQTLTQQHVPHHQLGRVTGNLMLIELVLIVPAYALAGPIADQAGIKPVMAACALVVAPSSLAPLLLPDVRRLRFLTTTEPLTKET